MKNKNLYAAAMDSVLHNNDTLGQFCKLFGNPEQAFNWLHQEHTEQEIITILRRLEFDIAPTIVGSKTKKFICKVGLK
jgi:hypothetical protein